MASALHNQWRIRQARQAAEIRRLEAELARAGMRIDREDKQAGMWVRAGGPKHWEVTRVRTSDTFAEHEQADTLNISTDMAAGYCRPVIKRLERMPQRKHASDEHVRTQLRPTLWQRIRAWFR